MSDLAEPFAMSLPAVSKHLKVLERARLVSRVVEGRTHTLHLEAEPMGEAADWLAYYQRFWGGALDSLGAFLSAPPPDPKANQTKRQQ